MQITFAAPLRSTVLSWSSACLLLVGSACDTDPGKDSAHAEVAEPATAAVAKPAADPAALAEALAGLRYAFSNADSKVAFVGAKITGQHDGGFEVFSGTIDLVDGDPSKSSVSVDIDNASITSDTEKLTKHLKSADFFDVERFPKTQFTSTAIAAGGDGSATHTVTGELELHGVTKTITFPATIRTAGDRVEVDAEFAINRKDFGIVYPGIPDDLIKDNVPVKLTLRAAKTPQA